ncbi:MAG: sugar ABC transporter permease [Aggregatilineales bacterium]
MAEISHRLPDSDAAPTTTTPSPGGIWHEMKRQRWAYFFIAPFYIMFLIFGLFPIGFSLYLSFHRWDGLGPMEFIGWQNFTYLQTPGGAAFWQSMRNSFTLMGMYVPLLTLIALIVAVLLNSERVRGFRIYRMLIFAPFVTSTIAAGFVFQLLLGGQGLFNTFLEAFSLPSVPWLSTVWGARISLSLLVFWSALGYNVVIMLSGLQTIPRELNDAAAIDGAGPIQIFFLITIPLMRPIILFSTVFSIVSAFGLFDAVVALGRGPLRANVTPLVQIFDVAFGQFEYGRASAQAYIYFLVIMLLTMLQFRFLGRNAS